jgi:hypothetical protein
MRISNIATTLAPVAGDVIADSSGRMQYHPPGPRLATHRKNVEMSISPPQALVQGVRERDLASRVRLSELNEAARATSFRKKVIAA